MNARLRSAKGETPRLENRYAGAFVYRLCRVVCFAVVLAGSAGSVVAMDTSAAGRQPDPPQQLRPMNDEALRERFARASVQMISGMRVGIEVFHPDGRHEYRERYLKQGAYTIDDSWLCVRFNWGPGSLCRRFAETSNGDIVTTHVVIDGQTLAIEPPISAQITEAEELT